MERPGFLKSGPLFRMQKAICGGVRAARRVIAFFGCGLRAQTKHTPLHRRKAGFSSGQLRFASRPSDSRAAKRTGKSPFGRSAVPGKPAQPESMA